MLWHHYKRHAVDLSGNANNGVHSGTAFTGTGLSHPAGTSSLSVLDSPELQGTTWTLFVYGAFRSQVAGARLIRKRAVGTQYDWLINTPSVLQFFLDGSTHNRTVDIKGADSLAITSVNGATPGSWVDGVFEGLYSSNAVMSADSAIVTIGDNGSSLAISDTLHGAIIFNEVLTVDEMLEVHAETLALKHAFDSRPYEISGGTKFVQRNGIYESVATVGVGELLENSGWKVQSGSFKIVHEVVNDKLQPVIECVTAGTVSIPTSRFHQTSVQAAYGTWSFDVKKLDATSITVGIGNSIGAPIDSGNYMIRASTGEVLALIRSGAATLITSSTPIVPDKWEHISLTRTGGNLFELFQNDVSEGTATDAVIVTASMSNIGMGVGDKFSGFTKDIA